MALSGWRRRLHLDAVLSTTLSFRVLQGVAGIVTIVLVGSCLTADQQGIYYTFISFTALQTIGDLGLYIAIVSIASHEWAALRIDDGQIVGDATARSRLISLSRAAAIGYGVCGVLLTAGTWLAGAWFFSSTLPSVTGLLGPWSAMTMLTMVSFVASPMVGVLEACGQLLTVSRFRLAGVIGASLASWTVLLTGHGLWALPAAAGCLAVRDIALLSRYRRFFRPCLAPAEAPRVEWRSEVWPMQWRLAVQGIAMYASTMMFTPLLLSVASPAAAGRFGMTWSVGVGWQSLSLAWLQTRAPELGRLAATGRDREMIVLWRSAAARAIAAMVLGGVALTAVISWLTVAAPSVALRLLPPLETAVLMAGFAASQGVQAVATYLRARKQERLLPSGLSASATAAFLAIPLTPLYGTAGAVAAYALAMAAVALPVSLGIWARTARLTWGANTTPARPRE